MKLLFVVPSFFPDIDGAAIREKGLVTGLKKLGHHVEVVRLGNEDKVYDSDGVKVHQISSKSSVFGRLGNKYFKYDKELYKKLKSKIFEILSSSKFDIIHTRPHFHLYKAGLEAGKKFSIPVVFEVHRMLGYSDYLLGESGYLRYKIMDAIERNFIKKADGIVCLSETGIENIKRHGIKSKFIVADNSSMFSLVKQKYLKGFSKKFIGENDKVLLYSGTARPNEGLELIPDIAKIAGDSYKFIITGKMNPYLESIKKKCEDLKLNNIVFAGFLNDDEIYTLYKDSGLFIYPRKNLEYHTDFIGLKFYDGLDVGLPTLTCDVGVLAEIIKKDKIGLTAKPDNAEDFARQVKKYFSSAKLRKELKSNINKYGKDHSWVKAAERLEKFYQRL